MIADSVGFVAASGRRVVYDATSPHTSPHLPTPARISAHLSTSPHISPHLPTSPHISPHLPTSPHISPHLPTSHHISPHLPTSPHISPTSRVVYDAEHFFDGFLANEQHALATLRAAAAAGAESIALCDTNGGTMPAEVERLVRVAVEAVGPAVSVQVHCHNDCALAVANSLAAVSAGTFARRPPPPLAIPPHRRPSPSPPAPPPRPPPAARSAVQRACRLAGPGHDPSSAPSCRRVGSAGHDQRDRRAVRQRGPRLHRRLPRAEERRCVLPPHAAVGAAADGAVAVRGRRRPPQMRNVSPHLPTSPHISPHLPTSPHPSPYLPISPHIRCCRSGTSTSRWRTSATPRRCPCST